MLQARKNVCLAHSSAYIAQYLPFPRVKADRADESGQNVTARQLEHAETARLSEKRQLCAEQIYIIWKNGASFPLATFKL